MHPTPDPADQGIRRPVINVEDRSLVDQKENETIRRPVGRRNERAHLLQGALVRFRRRHLQRRAVAGDPQQGKIPRGRGLCRPSETKFLISIMAYAFHSGDSYTLKKYWAKAEQHYEHELAREPDNALLLSSFLLASQFAGRHDIGEAIADRLFAKANVTAEMYYTIAGTFCKVGRVEEAVKCIRIYIDSGEAAFDAIDPEWFAALEGTSEYRFILDNHAQPTK